MDDLLLSREARVELIAHAPQRNGFRVGATLKAAESERMHVAPFEAIALGLATMLGRWPKEIEAVRGA